MHTSGIRNNRPTQVPSADRIKVYPQNLKSLTLCKQSLVFKCLQYKSSKNTVGKGEIAHIEQFLIFPVFSTLLENIQHLSSNLKLSSADSLT